MNEIYYTVGKDKGKKEMENFFQINVKKPLHFASVLWIHDNSIVDDSFEVNPIECVIASAIASNIYEEQIILPFE